MVAPDKNSGGLEGYTTMYREVPDQPEVIKFVSKSRKMIVVNLAAKKDAKIIKLIP